MRIRPCDSDVFENGQSVCLVDIPKETAENICRSLSAATGCKIDWHYAGGRVHIKALAAPVVERQEPIGIEGMPQYLILFDDTERPVETMFGEEIAHKRYADISMSWNAHLFVKIDSNSRDAMFSKNNATIVTSPPAPVSVVPDDIAQNAKRYEWIRSPNVGHCEISRVLFETISDDCNPPYRALKCGKDLDVAIDACIDKVKELNQ